ncbi:hypothetical protein A2U01_0065342, partial [Trifolium medium]|nr:hypothetical protein [Trifolium medium]
QTNPARSAATRKTYRGNKHILRAAQTNSACSASHRRSDSNRPTSLRAAQANPARRPQERTDTTVQGWRAAQHEPARSAAFCNTRRNAILLE